MRKSQRLLFVSIALALLTLTCNLPLRLSGSATAAPTALPGQVLPTLATPGTASEKPVQAIPLAGPVTRATAELSGLAWYGDYLILLPQYPARFGKKENGGALLALPRSAILDYLEGRSKDPLQPTEVPFISAGLERKIKGFEGFEALGFIGNRAYFTIEAKHSLTKMMGYLVAGDIDPSLKELRLEADSLVENPPQLDQSNHTDEALLITADGAITFFESNGAALNPAPHGTRFDISLHPSGTVPFPWIEYRVTDATTLDEQGRFWVINYFFPGEPELQTSQDPLAKQYGQGATHAVWPYVERLVELQYRPEGITLTDTPPIQMLLIDEPRNWEGVVRLEGYGFLLVSDKHPETILGFIAYP